MRKPAIPLHDELDGPVCRTRIFVFTETLDRSTGKFGTPMLLPETRLTVVKQGGTIDLMASQPVFDLDQMIRRALLNIFKEKE